MSQLTKQRLKEHKWERKDTLFLILFLFFMGFAIRGCLKIAEELDNLNAQHKVERSKQ